ncbi:hypothetical protein AKJ16_DCAP24069 [Drosera capensis]
MFAKSLTANSRTPQIQTSKHISSSGVCLTAWSMLQGHNFRYFVWGLLGVVEWCKKKKKSVRREEEEDGNIGGRVSRVRDNGESHGFESAS